MSDLEEFIELVHDVESNALTRKEAIDRFRAINDRPGAKKFGVAAFKRLVDKHDARRTIDRLEREIKDFDCGIKFGPGTDYISMYDAARRGGAELRKKLGLLEKQLNASKAKLTKLGGLQQNLISGTTVDDFADTEQSAEAVQHEETQSTTQAAS